MTTPTRDAKSVIFSFCDIPTLSAIELTSKRFNYLSKTDFVWKKIHSTLELPQVAGVSFRGQVIEHYSTCLRLFSIYYPKVVQEIGASKTYACYAACMSRLDPSSSMQRITPELFSTWSSSLTRSIPAPLDRPPVERLFVYNVFNKAPFSWCKVVKEILISEDLPHAVRGAIDAGRTQWLEQLMLPIYQEMRDDLRSFTLNSPLKKKQKKKVFRCLNNAPACCRLDFDMEAVLKRQRLGEK